jgi:SAM-dependent methyltransferase
MPGGDEIRDAQRTAWAGLSAGWEKWDPVIMDQLGPVGAAMIERLGIAGDQQHLDIAAGTGEPGLTIARLAPGGHVVLTDLAVEMLDIAARRANAQRITNVETRVCSADDLPFGDAAFDSISVRFGYMFFPRRRHGDRRVRARAQRARVARSRGACAGQRTGARADRGSRHRQGQHLRTRRPGTDSGPGALHRRHEAGTPAALADRGRGSCGTGGTGGGAGPGIPRLGRRAGRRGRDLHRRLAAGSGCNLRQ